MRPAREVYNLIRGSNPAPGAHAMLYATKVRIFDARMTLGETTVPPGTILASENDRIDIALDGGVLHAHRLQREGGKKLPAAEFAAEMGAVVGDGFEDGVVEAG